MLTNLIAGLLLAAGHSGRGPAQMRYLALQLFTATHDAAALDHSFPPLAGRIRDQVGAIIRAVGTVGGKQRKLGFIVGPLAFDDTDERIRALMRQAFAIALDKNVATGFHIDDSMFWGRLKILDKPENIEWLDWRGTPDTGRRLDWSSTPTKIMPQLCVNSRAVRAAVARRAALIGAEVKRGIKLLQATGRTNLFIGVIAGWETQLGRDFATGKHPGYHALANKGFSLSHEPADVDQARVAIVREFVNFWTSSLARAGVPDDKIYSHIAFASRTAFDMSNFARQSPPTASYLKTVNFTPPSAAFGPHHQAGFSTYPQFGFMDQLQAERAKQGNPPWASSEGTALDPGIAERGGPDIGMENYLGDLYGHGAVLVNVFGWGVGPPSNPFRRVAEGPGAISAYRKFLKGEPLRTAPAAQAPSPEFFTKMKRLQTALPLYLKKNGMQRVGRLYGELSRALSAQRFVDAESAVDGILKAISTLP